MCTCSSCLHEFQSLQCNLRRSLFLFEYALNAQCAHTIYRPLTKLLLSINSSVCNIWIDFRIFIKWSMCMVKLLPSACDTYVWAYKKRRFQPLDMVTEYPCQKCFFYSFMHKWILLICTTRPKTKKLEQKPFSLCKDEMHVSCGVFLCI